MYESVEDICDQIIELDKCIRFAGFATKAGKIIACKYRKDLIPLLTSDETQLSFIDSALMMRIREAREPKLGKVICSIVLYEKVTHGTILVNSEDYPILMVSFDMTNKRIDHESLILHGILPLLSRYFETKSKNQA
jgi:hypothetical protein